MQVRVWNKNIHPFKQKFEGEMVEIPAGKYILMDEDHANKFLSTYSPVVVDGGGTPLPESYKKLVIDKVGIKEQVSKMKPSDEFKCLGCGFEAPSEKALSQHINEKHLDDLADPEERKKRQKGNR
jgi:hypothetical protein